MTPPLPPTQRDILVILSAGPRHGYAIMQAADALHGATAQLGPAQLYTHLEKLLDKGWIRETPSPDTRRRVYTLTPEGQQAIAQDMARQQAYLDRAQHWIAGGAPCAC